MTVEQRLRAIKIVPVIAISEYFRIMLLFMELVKKILISTRAGCCCCHTHDSQQGLCYRSSRLNVDY